MDHIIGDTTLGTQTQTEKRGSVSSAAVVSPSKSDTVDEEEQAAKDEKIAKDAEFNSILSKLVEDVKILQCARNSSAVKFGNFGIANLRDCSKWINENFKEHQYGLIIDPLIMLDRIHVEYIAPANERSVLAIMKLFPF